MVQRLDLIAAPFVELTKPQVGEGDVGMFGDYLLVEGDRPRVVPLLPVDIRRKKPWHRIRGVVRVDLSEMPYRRTQAPLRSVNLSEDKSRLVEGWIQLQCLVKRP